MTEKTEAPVWLITGCSSGLGRALSGHVLEKGHRLVATARDPEKLAPLAESHPDTCRTLALDVADAPQIEETVSQAKDFFGRLDVIVNNAGVGLLGAFEETGTDQIQRNLAVNFLGPLAVIRAALPILREQRSGCIVNISAAAAIDNYPGFSIYGAAKSALEAASESIAAELKPLGIKVVVVQPGPFRTDFIGRSLERAVGGIEDYAATSGKFAKLIESMDGKQTGDPAKAAAAIFEAVESDKPPLRLVLGKYAQDKVRRKLAATQRELDAWAQIGLNVDFNQG